MRVWQLLLILSCASCSNTNEDVFIPRKGDILFQDLDSSPLCEAIEKVTPGHKNGKYSHVGIIFDLDNHNLTKANGNHNDYIKVIEAIPNNVKATRLDSFLKRSLDKEGRPKVIVGRLKKKYDHSIEHAINFLRNKIGAKYDRHFLINNNSYYCSELIYEAFLRDSIFDLQPMSFFDPETNDISETWKKYYAELNIQIPENQPGINPGAMSISKKIDIIHYYGIPSGMNK